MASQLVLLRVLAFLVDSLLVTISLVIPATLASWGIISIQGGSSRAFEWVWIVAVVASLVGILLRDGWKGRSPGKQLLGLRVATTSGKQCGYGRSFVRNLPVFVPLLNLVEIYLLIFSTKSRRIGDRMAGTNVVEE